MDKSNSLLRLDDLNLVNYRRFSSLHVRFDPDLTVIIARNGCGKTAVLDAIAVALGPFVGAFDTAKGSRFSQTDVRLVPKPDKSVKESEPQYPLVLKAVGQIGGEQKEWILYLLSPKSHATHEGARDLADYGKKLQKSVRDSAASIPNADILLPLVSYYGTGRLWGEKRLTQGKKAETNLSRTAGYTDCLNSASKYKIFADWFERLCRSEFEERDNPKALGEITAMLAAVRNAVNSMLEPSGWSNIAFKSAQDGIVAEHPRFGLMSVDWLSDGIRNMIAMVADIAHRAVRLNSHLGENAAKETPGIVLIDEVDMHLHPEWQQSVISSLRQAFPRIQFIVTTHSPQVLSTVRREQIRLLLENGEVENLADDIGTYGAESSFILQEVLEVDSRPQSIETVGKLKKYQKLVEDRREDTDEGRNLRQELEASLGKHDRALLTADIRISQLKILRPS